MRLDASLSEVLSSVSLPDQNRPNALAIDGQDNVVLFGGAPATAIQATPGTYLSPALGLICTDTNRFFFGIDSFITKLAAADWKPIYTAHLAAPCGMHLGSMILDQFGAPVRDGRGIFAAERVGRGPGVLERLERYRETERRWLDP